MRTATSSIFALLLASAAVPAAADPAVDQFINQIRSWDRAYATMDELYYISPEDTNDGVPGHTYKTADLFDEPTTFDEGQTPIWGYIAVREYDCARQTMTVKNYAMIQVDGVKWDNMVGTPAQRSEIRADEGIAYFARACGAP
jgi:hypothetical protein